MNVHPTPFPGSKTQSVKSKYKKISEAPPPPRNRRTFGTIRNPNVPEKAVPEKPKAKPSNHITLKPQKTEPEIAVVQKPEPAKKTPQNGSNRATARRKKKSVAFSENGDGSAKKNYPVREVDSVKTPVRPPFSTKPVRIPGTPYLSAEKCSSCRFDRLETASYWLGQIKSAEVVGKHFVSVTFFRLANDCKAEPFPNLQTELKKYLARHQNLSTKAEWKDVSYIYGIIKEETTESGDQRRDIENAQEHRIEKQNENDEVRNIWSC
ncbi:hypothetical protein LXL04_013024 [Taraxacum kok-saghyz]